MTSDPSSTVSGVVRFASLAARAVGLRCVLRRKADAFEVVRTGWGLARDCKTLDDVDRLLRLIGHSGENA